MIEPMSLEATSAAEAGTARDAKPKVVQKRRGARGEAGAGVSTAVLWASGRADTAKSRMLPETGAPQFTTMRHPPSESSKARGDSACLRLPAGGAPMSQITTVLAWASRT